MYDFAADWPAGLTEFGGLGSNAEAGPGAALLMRYHRGIGATETDRQSVGEFPIWAGAVISGAATVKL
jgi:hypothetical protein